MKNSINNLNKITMKKLLIIATISLITACTTPNTYTISGEVAGVDSENKEIYLYSMGTDVTLDTAVIKEGKYLFEGTLENPDIAVVMVEKKKNYVPFILEPGDIIINISEDGTGNPFGTTLNKAMQKLKEEELKIDKEYSEISDKLKVKYSEGSKDFEAELSKIYKEDIAPKIKALHKSELEKNKNNILGVDIYTNHFLNSEELEDINLFIAENPFAANHKPLNSIAEIKKIKKNTAVGKMFVDFNARNMEDTKDVKLSDYVGKGKYVLADFWASWCPPCRTGMPHIAELNKKYADKGLVVLGVNVSDELPSAQKAVKDMDMIWAQIFVPERGYATGLYGIQGIPTVVIFAPDGTIVHRSNGGEIVTKYIESVIK